MGNDSPSFGHYEIIRRLGTGGMAETFEAVRPLGGAQQRVCLKRVLPAYSDDAKFNELFLTEVRLAASLRHTNIVSVLDFGAIDGSEFMVLELVDGMDLRALLSTTVDRRLDAELVTLIALDLAQALSYAHNTRNAGLEGIVHRDISPANVMVSVTGEVKLADFGIAKAMTNSQATTSGQVRGKIPYMAPEQMRAERIDGRADLFSLGVSLFEALAGRRPFQGAHDVQVMARIVAGERPTLRELVPDAPGGLVDAIEGLLAIDADERTASAERLIDTLESCASSPLARCRLAELVRTRVEGAVSATDASSVTDTASTAPADAQCTDGPSSTPASEAQRSGEAWAAERDPSTRAAPDVVPRETLEEISVGSGTPSNKEARRPMERRAVAIALAAVLLAGSALAFGLLTHTPAAAPSPPLARHAEPPTVAPVPDTTVAPDAGVTPPPAVGGPRDPPASEPRAEASMDGFPFAELAEDSTDASPEAAAEPRTRRRVRSPSISVTIRTVPWGGVWVDRRYIGPSPATVSLRVGPHMIGGGARHIVATKRVRVTHRANQSFVVQVRYPGR